MKGGSENYMTIRCFSLFYFWRNELTIIIDRQHRGGETVRKVMRWSLFLYVGFALFIYWYLFGWNHEIIPDMYKGTSADPQTFMNARDLH